MDKTKVLIVEDEFIVSLDIEETLKAFDYHVSGTAESYEEAVKILIKEKPDIAIVDITLKGDKTGIDFGKYIRQNFNLPFIYLSSHSDKKTIKNAKESNPDAYLVKPFKEADLFSSIEVALHNFAKINSNEKQVDCTDNILFKDSIFIKKDCSFNKVKLQEMVYIKSDGNYLELIVENKKKYLIRSSLKEFTKCLPSDIFIRIHNSHVVNINYISKISPTYILLNEYKIPLSRNGKEQLKNKMITFS